MEATTTAVATATAVPRRNRYGNRNRNGNRNTRATMAARSKIPTKTAVVVDHRKSQTQTQTAAASSSSSSSSSSFWDEVRNTIRTNEFRCEDGGDRDRIANPVPLPRHEGKHNSNESDNNSSSNESDNDTRRRNNNRRRQWLFRSRKSHILDTNGHYAWMRELNCFQGQSLPEAIYPNNTLEIVVRPRGGQAVTAATTQNNGGYGYRYRYGYRIRFGAIEGLRGWMALDSEPIPTAAALGSDHWKRLAKYIPAGGSAVVDSIFAPSYDYTYTTPYKGGTDRVRTAKGGENGGDGDGDGDYYDYDYYDYLRPDSSSFVPKHDAGAHDVAPAAATRARGKGTQTIVKLRKPICKCKSDGGRAPLVSTKNTDNGNGTATATGEENQNNQSQSRSQSQSQSQPLPENDPLPSPTWKRINDDDDDGYRVDIEGMLKRAAAQNPHRPFAFRDDVDLWEDDLHESGLAWLKARTFVCREGWACLLRNFVRVDGVRCRVIDTRYAHRFGTSRVYREHSWREGSWDELLSRMGGIASAGRATPPTTTTTTPARGSAATRQVPVPVPVPQDSRPSPVSLESINDSIAARHLPVVRPPVTEYLCLESLEQHGLNNDDEGAGGETNNTTNGPIAPIPTSMIVKNKKQRQQQQQQQQHLVMINDPSIEDAIPLPISNDSYSTDQPPINVSFLLKRSKGRVLEAIHSSDLSSGHIGDGDGAAASSHLAASSVWSKTYTTYHGEDGNGDGDAATRNDAAATATATATATILSVQISPNLRFDGGRVAIGDDSGWVQVWRLATGEFLYGFPVAPASIRDRKTRNPLLFQSERLWVRYLAWSGDGSRIGASAGRTTVLAATSRDCDCDRADAASLHDDTVRIVSTLESTSGSVTGLAFRESPGGGSGGGAALAVASYGEVSWIPYRNATANANANATEREIDAPATLRRAGAAVESLAISPNGERVAVGFLDKTLRIFNIGKETATRTGESRMNFTTATNFPRSEIDAPPKPPPSNSNSNSNKNNDDTVILDWLGFNAAVKSLQFSSDGKWLAAVGGITILVLREDLDSRTEAPIACRTLGRPESDGRDGTCHRFSRIQWSSPSSSPSSSSSLYPATDGVEQTTTESILLAALDAKDSSIHLFSFVGGGGSGSSVTGGGDDTTTTTTNQKEAWPHRAFPIRTISPSFLHPSPFTTTALAFFSASLSCGNEQTKNHTGFLVLDTTTGTGVRPTSDDVAEVVLDEEHQWQSTSQVANQKTIESVITRDECTQEKTMEEEFFSFRMFW